MQDNHDDGVRLLLPPWSLPETANDNACDGGEPVDAADAYVFDDTESPWMMDPDTRACSDLFDDDDEEGLTRDVVQDGSNIIHVDFRKGCRVADAPA